MKNILKKKITKKELKRRERIDQKKRLKQWSIDVRNRDGNKCSICGVTKYIHAHHILPKEVKEFKFDIENGIAICAKHHRYSREISGHANSFTFMIWFMENRKSQYEVLLVKVKNSSLLSSISQPKGL